MKLVVNLSSYYPDHRSYSRIFINENIKTIRDLKKYIRKVFNIHHFYLACDNQYLPSSQEIMVLNSGETVRVVPIDPASSDDVNKDKLVPDADEISQDVKRSKGFHVKWADPTLKTVQKADSHAIRHTKNLNNFSHVNEEVVSHSEEVCQDENLKRKRQKPHLKGSDPSPKTIQNAESESIEDTKNFESSEDLMESLFTNSKFENKIGVDKTQGHSNYLQNPKQCVKDNMSSSKKINVIQTIIISGKDTLRVAKTATKGSQVINAQCNLTDGKNENKDTKSNIKICRDNESLKRKRKYENPTNLTLENQLSDYSKELNHLENCDSKLYFSGLKKRKRKRVRKKKPKNEVTDDTEWNQELLDDPSNNIEELSLYCVSQHKDLNNSVSERTINEHTITEQTITEHFSQRSRPFKSSEDSLNNSQLENIKKTTSNEFKVTKILAQATNELRTHGYDTGSDDCMQKKQELDLANTNGNSSSYVSDERNISNQVFNTNIEITESFLSELPISQHTFPNVRDGIAFKILKLNHAYSPVVSSYIVGTVSHASKETGCIVVDIMYGLEECEEPQGKFSVDYADQEAIQHSDKLSIREFQWSLVTEVKYLPLIK